LRPVERDRLTGYANTLLAADEHRTIEAAKALEGAGTAAVAPLLKLDLAKAPPEAQQRVERLLRTLYGAHESWSVRDRVAAYLKLGVAGDVGAMRQRFWNGARRQQFVEEEKEFMEERIDAARNDDRAKRFRDIHGLPADARPQDVTYEQALARRLRVRDVRLERIRLSGPRAAVTISVVLSPSHPEFCYHSQYGLERVVSNFTMEFDGKQWLAGREGPINDEDAILWLRGGPDGVLEANRTEVAVDQAEDTVAGSVGAFAYSVSFGY
jgi:hypothetical protein